MTQQANGYWTGQISYTDPYGNTTTIPVGSTDEDGISWYWLSLSGWDGVAVVGSVTQQSADHGGWPTPQYYAPRTMTWTVYAQAPNQTLRDVARSKFQRAIPVSDLATFTYDEPVSKTCQIRRAAALPEVYATLTEVQFAAAIIAPDPRKYKSTQRTLTANALSTPTGGWTLPNTLPLDTPDGLPNGNVISLPNDGDFETRPVVTIQGPVDSPSLLSTATGQRVSFNGVSLGAQDILTVDFYNRIARKNASIVLADVTSAWWVIPPNGTQMVYGGSFSAASSATAVYRDAWI